VSGGPAEAFWHMFGVLLTLFWKNETSTVFGFEICCFDLCSKLSPPFFELFWEQQFV
jgi:hypothetical protein